MANPKSTLSFFINFCHIRSVATGGLTRFYPNHTLFKIKKFIVAFTAIAVCVLTITHTADCQTKNELAGMQLRTSIPAPGDKWVLKINSQRDYINNINIKIVREFLKNFADAEQVVWGKGSDGYYFAQFLMDSVQTTICYNNNGSWRYIIKKYGEEKMESRLRNRVKNIFANFSIVEVREMMWWPKEASILYSVEIKNANIYKILKIENDAIKIVTECTKL